MLDHYRCRTRSYGRSRKGGGKPSFGRGNQYHELAEEAEPEQQLFRRYPLRLGAAAKGKQGISGRFDDP